MAIKLEKYWWIFKTKKALEFFRERYVDIFNDWLDIFSYYMPKAAACTKKKIWKVNWKDLADRVFSEYVRLYYADDKWYVKCFTSWVRLPRNEAQNGHYRDRWYTKYRFDIRNCHPQTHLDNVIKWWNYRDYHKNMVAEYGEEIENMLRNDNELVDYNQEWYEDHILEWYDFIKQKKQQIGG